MEDEREDHGDGCYYKIYLSTHTEKLVVVCMQWFDEYDYHKERFYRGEDGEPVKFYNEGEAIRFLNANFKLEYIEPEFRSPNNPEFMKERFEEMRRPSGEV